ncbi:hypothetical protein A1F94_005452 [Pyrenophora tritici-repentis]|nr:hypothetical protein A1F94_005452 [Pyrenophora tritici-repentis]
MLLLCTSKVRGHMPAKWIKWLLWLIILIRFVIFAPTIYYNIHATNHSNVINNHAQLYNGTYGTAIVTGQRFTERWGAAVFYYSLASWFPSFVFMPPLHLPFTVVDTTLAVFVSMATHYQSAYSPRNNSDCHNPEFPGMQRPPGTNESFFEAAARLNATVSTPTNMCLSFVKEWQYGVTLSFFYALMSLLGIILFFGAIRDAKQQGTSVSVMFRELGNDICWCLLLIPKAFLIFFLILYAIPLISFRCLPLSVKAPIRCARRYMIKSRLGTEQNTKIALKKSKSMSNKSKKSPGRYQGGEGSHTELAQFLGVYDILILIAKDLHYIDVMNLALVSKSVRKSVLPSYDLARRLPIYKLYTCNADDKRSCWKPFSITWRPAYHTAHHATMNTLLMFRMHIQKGS